MERFTNLRIFIGNKLCCLFCGKQHTNLSEILVVVVSCWYWILFLSGWQLICWLLSYGFRPTLPFWKVQSQILAPWQKTLLFVMLRTWCDLPSLSILSAPASTQIQFKYMENINLVNIQIFGTPLNRFFPLKLSCW